MNRFHLVTAALVLGAGWASTTRAADPVPVPAVDPAAITPDVLPAATLSPAGEGRRLYLKLNCYGCHGMRGAGGMGPNIVRKEAGDVREAVLQGKGEGMPSYRAWVTGTDVQNLIAYLASIGRADEPTFRDWWVAVPRK